MKNQLLIFVAYFLVSSAFSQSLEEAKKLTENEQYESATEIYKKIISKEPNNGNYYYYFSENLLLSENPDSSLLIINQGKQIDPGNSLFKIGIAKIYLNSANLAEAKAASSKDPSNATLKKNYDELKLKIESAFLMIDEAVAATNQKNAQVFMEAADALINYKNKNLDKAKTLLEKAVAQDSKNPGVQILFGDIYTELNNGTLAADYYNRALELDKNSARAIVSKGRLYKRSTNYEGAAAEFENAIKIDPNYAPAYRELGETYFKLGKLTKAKECYRKYLELSKNNCGARVRYSSFLYISKDYTNALSELAQVQQKCDPNDLRMLRIYSYCYYETKEFSKGLEMVNRLFQLLPEEKRTAIDIEYYGKLLIANNQDSIGILQLRLAYTMAPEKTELLTEIAKAYYKQKHYAEAAQTFNEKINIGKDVKTADYFMLGQSHYFTSQFMQADTAFTKYTEMAPKVPSGWLWRAKSNSQIDSTSEAGLAKPYFEKYIELAMEDSANAASYQLKLIEPYSYLAYYYILKKDTANALLYLKKKIELPLEPEDKKRVQQAIDQLEGKKPSK